MSSPFPVRLVVLIAAAVGAAAAVALAWRGNVEGWLALLGGIVAGVVVIWVALALDQLARRGTRPDRADIRVVIDLQRANRALLDAHDARLARAETLLAWIAAEPALAEADRDLEAATAQVETWDAVLDAVPRWIAAEERWTALAHRLGALSRAESASAILPDDAALRRARDRLPATGNFSSQELKAALNYLVRAERWATKRTKFAERRSALLDGTVDPAREDRSE